MTFDLLKYKSLFNILSGDKRITVWHIAIIMAIIRQASWDNIRDPVFTSRKKIMELTNIGSIVTYHKCIKELQEFGYIEYRPSYHPGIGSYIALLFSF